MPIAVCHLRIFAPELLKSIKRYEKQNCINHRHYGDLYGCISQNGRRLRANHLALGLLWSCDGLWAEILPHRPPHHLYLIILPVLSCQERRSGHGSAGAALAAVRHALLGAARHFAAPGHSGPAPGHCDSPDLLQKKVIFYPHNEKIHFCV